MTEYKIPRPTADAGTVREYRVPLPPDTLIIDKRVASYRIKNEPAGFGGSALIYKAERAGSLRNFILKECYPFSKKFSFERDKVAVRADSDDAKNYLALVKKNMIREGEIGQRLANDTGRTIAAWEALNVDKIIIGGETFDGSASCFIVMEQADDNQTRGWFLKDLLAEVSKPAQVDAPLRTGGNPSPYVAACIIEELLKSLRDIHKAGYIHGDINDANFFLMGHDPANADIGVGQLLDFGNALKLEADGLTAPVKNIFSTPGYWSPEILNHADNLRLSPATDIFSVGCLMLYLLNGMNYKRTRGRTIAKNFSVEVFVPVKKVMACGYRREAAGVFRKILTKALQKNPQERYPDASTMLKDIIFLKKVIAPPKFTLATNLTRSPYFVKGSRDKELAHLQEMIDGGEQPLWIWGAGGLGKTELAMEFARKEIERGRTACLVTFRGSIKQTVLDMNFSGFEFEGDADAEYKARLNLLKENYKDALLIVDNFDAEDKVLSELQAEPAYRELLGLDMKILFTTRSRPNNSVPELEPLDEENSLRLFKSIAQVDDEEIVRKLLREVDCHPMTVEILAHTLNESWGLLTAKQLLIKLRAEALNSPTLPEVKHKKVQSEREAKIYGHLRTLFNMLSLDENYRDILCTLTLLPIDGFDAAEFLLNLSLDKKKLLRRLEANAWIRRRAENNLLWIHPLIRTVFKNELKPRRADCQKFLDTLWERLDNVYPQDKKIFRQAGELFDKAVKDFEDADGTNHFRAGFCYIIGEKFSLAWLMTEKAVELGEAALDANDLALARRCNDASVAAFYLQQYEQGMGYIEKARQILEANAPDDPNVANLFSNMANVHILLGDYDKAVKFGARAVEIFERTPPKNLHEQAHAYSIFGNALLWLKRFAEAEENFIAAERILKEIAPEGSAELEKCYIDLAQVKALNNDFAAAEDFAQRAIEWQKKILPKNHNELLDSYNVLSAIYRKAGKDKESAEVAALVQKIIREELEKSTKSLLAATLDMIELYADQMSDDEFIKRHRAVADSYLKLGDLDNARKFINIALEKICATTAAERSLTYFTAADIFAAQKNFADALNYAEKSLKIVETAEPNNFSYLSTNYLHMANLYEASGKFAEAVKYFELTIEFEQKSPYPNHDLIALIQNSVERTRKSETSRP